MSETDTSFKRLHMIFRYSFFFSFHVWILDINSHYSRQARLQAPFWSSVGRPPPGTAEKPYHLEKWRLKRSSGRPQTDKLTSTHIRSPTSTSPQVRSPRRTQFCCRQLSWRLSPKQHLEALSPASGSLWPHSLLSHVLFKANNLQPYVIKHFQ